MRDILKFRVFSFNISLIFGILRKIIRGVRVIFGKHLDNKRDILNVRLLFTHCVVLLYFQTQNAIQ